jgi:hypothetical protein
MDERDVIIFEGIEIERSLAIQVKFVDTFEEFDSSIQEKFRDLLKTDVKIKKFFKWAKETEFWH